MEYSKLTHNLRHSPHMHATVHPFTQPLSRFAIGLVGLCLLFTEPAWPQATSKQLAPAKGMFLVASKDLDGSDFHRTVVLLTGYSTLGASGLAINRPSKISIHEAFPKLPRFNGDAAMMNLGGPVHTNAVFVLIQTQQPATEMLHVFKDIFMASSLNALKRAPARKQQSIQARAYAGYSGWAPGQLEAEIEQGRWLVIEADPQIIFTEDREKIWPQLMKSGSGLWI